MNTNGKKEDSGEFFIDEEADAAGVGISDIKELGKSADPVGRMISGIRPVVPEGGEAQEENTIDEYLGEAREAIRAASRPPSDELMDENNELWDEDYGQNFYNCRGKARFVVSGSLSAYYDRYVEVDGKIVRDLPPLSTLADQDEIDTVPGIIPQNRQEK